MKISIIVDGVNLAPWIAKVEAREVGYERYIINALTLSLAAWHPSRAHRVGDLCALCERYCTSSLVIFECKGCPFNLYGLPEDDAFACNHPKHPYDRWVSDRTVENQRRVYKALLKLWRAELAKGREPRKVA